MNFRNILIPILFLMASKVHAEGCNPRLVDHWDRLNFDQKKVVFNSLTSTDMECLYKSAVNKSAPSAKFFVDNAHRNQNQIQRFLGKNSLALFNHFEKHFFIVDNGQDVKMYGYNDSSVTRLAGSPGFFAPVWKDKKLYFDYRLDFPSLISLQDLAGVEGIKVESVKSNEGDLFFGGLVDEIRAITSDMVVGRGVKYTRDSEKFQAYFVLLRDPN